jgi:DUF4097 and DUF4098 domain-containing protein YvlB
MQRRWLITAPIILVMVIICIAISITLWTTLMSGSSTGFPSFDAELDRYTAQAEDQQSFTVNTPASLTIDNFSGWVHVSGGEGNTISVTAHKIAWGADQAKADSNLARLVVEMSQNGDAVQISVGAPENSINSRLRIPSVEFTVAVPFDTMVMAKTHSGELILSNTSQAAKLSSDNGNIIVTGINNGNLSIHSSNGAVSIQEVDTGSNPIELTSGTGRITLEKLNCNGLIVDSKNSEITLNEVNDSGDTVLSNEFGDLTFTAGRSGKLNLQSKNGSINLSDLVVDGPLTAHTDSGSLTITRVNAYSDELSTRNGAINISGISNELKAHTDLGDIVVSEAENSRVDLSSKNGGITFAGTLGDGPNALEANSGSIQVGLPVGTGLTLDLSASFGLIKSDYEVAFRGEPDQKHWTGDINGGGPILTAITRNGNISIVKLNP